LPLASSRLSSSTGAASVGPISDFDAQIAAITRARNMSLATRDTRDFLETGVQIIDPWQP
jgi:predicted nucleic acid-binding protein